MFVHYLLATAAELPPISAPLYEYVFAGNGVFKRAARKGKNPRTGEALKIAAHDGRLETVAGFGFAVPLLRPYLAEARRVGLARIFCLTYQVEFFQALGFVRVDRSRLPEKVWGECVRCSKFFDCDEVALWREV